MNYKKFKYGTLLKSESIPLVTACLVAQTSSKMKNIPGGDLPSINSTTIALLKYSIDVHLIFSAKYSS